VPRVMRPHEEGKKKNAFDVASPKKKEKRGGRIERNWGCKPCWGEGRNPPPPHSPKRKKLFLTLGRKGKGETDEKASERPALKKLCLLIF